MADARDIDWPKGTKLPFRITYFPITGVRHVPADAIAQVVRKAGGRAVAIYEARQLGRLFRALPIRRPMARGQGTEYAAAVRYASVARRV